LNADAYKNVYGMNMKWVVGGRIYHTAEGKFEGNGFMDGETFTIRTPEDLKTNWDDTHAWLEDEEGLVYDCVTEIDYITARGFDPSGYKFKMKAGFIVGDTYKNLKQKGLEYVPYPMEHRKVVLDTLKMFHTIENRPLVVGLMHQARLE
jgi:hypothetical protein